MVPKRKCLFVEGERVWLVFGNAYFAANQHGNERRTAVCVCVFVGCHGNASETAPIAASGNGDVNAIV